MATIKCQKVLGSHLNDQQDLVSVGYSIEALNSLLTVGWKLPLILCVMSLSTTMAHVIRERGKIILARWKSQHFVA